jgi:hypothetical protein
VSFLEGEKKNKKKRTVSGLTQTPSPVVSKIYVIKG